MESWIRSHPYLDRIARFQQIVEEFAAGVAAVPVPLPQWESYAEEHQLGIPLLRSSVDRLCYSASAATVVGEMLGRLTAADLPEGLGGACRDLRNRFEFAPADLVQTVERIARGAVGESIPMHQGLLRFLGWTGLSQVLEPVVESFFRWRNPDHWGKGYCPTCGSLPVMGQLIPGEPARQRFLACGCCRTRWKFRRIGCPFCGMEDSDRLTILQIESGEPLRIDVCEPCRGYLKTYTDQGEEKLFLADWTTLHLDVLAQERGLERKGAPLYEI